MTELRDRIAAALAVIECEDRCGAPKGHPGCEDCVERMLPQADAVIAELGLRREDGYPSRITCRLGYPGCTGAYEVLDHLDNLAARGIARRDDKPTADDLQCVCRSCRRW